jgi:hypothetical protein
MPKDVGGGGITITGGNVNTAGGDIVGRDKIQHVSSHQMDDLFGPIGKVIETAQVPMNRSDFTFGWR